MLTVANVHVPAVDERAIRCAEHNTTFYAAYPRAWGATRLLRELAAHFQVRGHVHPPFETVDLVPASAIVPRPARTTERRAA